MRIVFFLFTKSKTVINHSEKKTKDYSTAAQFHTFIIFIANLNAYILKFVVFNNIFSFIT